MNWNLKQIQGKYKAKQSNLYQDAGGGWRTDLLELLLVESPSHYLPELARQKIPVYYQNRCQRSALVQNQKKDVMTTAYVMYSVVNDLNLDY